MTSHKTFRINGTGCALVDYLYNPVDFNLISDSGLISKNPGDGGLSPGKLVFTEEFEKFAGIAYNQVRQKLTQGKKPIAVNIGGPSIVALIHAAQMLEFSDAEVRFFGCRGNDEAGQFLCDNLKRTPLKIGSYKTCSKNTPFTDVLSDPDFDNGHGERIFINNIGAAWELLPDDLTNSFFEADMVIFGGTGLVPFIHSSLLELLKKARLNNAITVVNTVYDFLNERRNPNLCWPLGESVETYSYIDLLVADLEEALRLSGTQTIDEAMQFFAHAGTGAVVITHGPNPVHFFAQNKLFGNVKKSTLPVSEKVVKELKDLPKTGDTTGCGDNFTGGMIASVATQLMQNPNSEINLKTAIAAGVASGGFACYYNGGTFYESYAGQKLKLVQDILHNYLEQIKG